VRENLLRQLAGEKIADDCCDLKSLAFQREMSGIEEVNFGVWVVAFEGLSTSRQEERIVLAPYREKRGPPRADYS